MGWVVFFPFQLIKSLANSCPFWLIFYFTFSLWNRKVWGKNNYNQRVPKIPRILWEVWETPSCFLRIIML